LDGRVDPTRIDPTLADPKLAEVVDVKH